MSILAIETISIPVDLEPIAVSTFPATLQDPLYIVHQSFARQFGLVVPHEVPKSFIHFSDWSKRGYYQQNSHQVNGSGYSDH